MIARHLEKLIDARMFSGKAILLMGPRQVGKTTLVDAILSRRKEPVLRLNADEPDVREILADITSQRLRSLIGRNRIVFIDEAQRIANIGLTLKLIVDQIPEVQVIATGSSALELAATIKEPLTGRKFEFFLTPFKFIELVSHHGELDETRLLNERLVMGSYPEIVAAPDRAIERLKLLADSFLYKDLLTLEELKKPQLLEKILRALALQIGSEVNSAELSRLVGAAIGTVEKYINLLTQAYIIFDLPAYSRNVRNEIRKARKIYFHDNGIRNAVLGNFQPFENRTDVGPLWENYLMSERQKIWANNPTAPSRHFWRTTQQQEIDYIEASVDSLAAFEFKWNPRARAKFPKTYSRAYPESSTQLVSPKTYAEFLRVEGQGIF
jgi:predicted AAA+ superfamily ATPase